MLPAAIDRAIWLAARPAANSAAPIVAALDLDAEAALDPTALPPPVPERRDDAATWIDYPRGVAWALARAGHPPAALDAVFGGDLPIGAGVSSSAAVEVAFLVAWNETGGGVLDRATLTRLGRAAENGYLGVGSGPMDQYASLHGAAGELLLLDCRTLTHKSVPLPAGLAVLVFDSGTRRALADSSYNDRPRECAAALEILQRRQPETRTLRDVTAAQLGRWAGDLPPPLDRRARHVVEECERVLRGADALAAGDIDAFGRLIDSSHASSRDLFEVSTPELDLLAEAATATDGCYGARLSGAGFGGCVTALVAADRAPAVAESVASGFAARFTRRPDGFCCAVAGGAEHWRR